MARKNDGWTVLALVLIPFTSLWAAWWSTKLWDIYALDRLPRGRTREPFCPTKADDQAHRSNRQHRVGPR